MNGRRGALLGSLLSVYVAPLAAAEPAMLRAVQSLDEPRGYCLDISGSGPTLDLEAALQAHTCKGVAPVDDQLFEASGQQLRSHDRCVTAEALEPGAPLHMRACADSRTQRWSFADGRLSPASRPEL